MALTLRKNFIWTLFGSGTYAACQWGMVVILARMGGKDVLGQFALALAVTAPIMLFCNLEIRSIQVTDVRNLYNFYDYLTVRIFTATFGFIIILLMALMVFRDTQTIGAIVVLGIAKAFESINDIYYGLQQRYERLDRVARSMIMRGILNVLAFGVVYFILKSLAASIGSLAVINVMVLFFYDIPASRTLPHYVIEKNYTKLFSFLSKIKIERCFNLIILALPMGFATVLVSLNFNVPRYFIKYYLNTEALGLFVALAYFIIIGDMVVNAFGQASSPKLASYYSDNNIKSFKNLFGEMALFSFAIGFISVLGSLFLGHKILRLIYGPEFIANSNIFPWIMTVSIFSYTASCVGYAMTASRQFRIQPIIFFMAFIVNIIGCFIFIPHYQLLGAVWGWISALLLQLILSLFIVMHNLNVLSRFYKDKLQEVA